MPAPRCAVLLLAAAGGLGLSGPALAQTAPEEETPIRLSGLDGMTVTATRAPIEAFSYPGAVSVIDRQEIDDLLPSTASDLFDGVPGMQFTGGPRRTGEMPAVRGMQGEGVLVLFDGVRQNFISGHDGQFFIEPDLLKSAEVVRGPASALYGSGALGGVIAFRVVDAADFLHTGQSAGYRVKAGYQGVNEEWTMGGTAFARSDDGRFDGVANLTYRASGDIKLGNGASLMSDDGILSGLLKGSIQVSDALKLSLMGQTFNNDATEPNNGQDVLATDRVNKDVTSNLLRAGAEFNPAGNDLIDAELTLYRNDAEVKEAETTSERVVSREVETLGIVLDNRSRFALGGMNALTFTYGGEYYHDEQVGTDNMTADGTRGGVPDATAKTLGLFIQAELSLDTPLGHVLVIPALRYDDFKNDAADGSLATDDDATSAKIGLTWEPTEWLMGYASYAQAFRAPGYNEIFADDIHFTIPLGPGLEAPNSFVANPDLQPEKSETWEVGGGVDFGHLFTGSDRFTAKASYYESDVDNLIDLEVDFEFSPSCFVPSIPLPCTAGTSRYANTRNAEISGFELAAAYESRRLFLTATYSSIDGTDTGDGSYVGVLTPNRYYLNGGVKLPEADARLGARIEIAEDFKKVNDPANARDGYAVVDLYAVWAPSAGPLKGLRIDLGVDNVADKAYERVFAGVTEPGRNVKAAASWTQTF